MRHVYKINIKASQVTFLGANLVASQEMIKILTFPLINAKHFLEAFFGCII